MPNCRLQTVMSMFLRPSSLIAYLCLLAPYAAVGEQPPRDGKSSVIIELSEAECRLLTRHQPDADVAYRPGVDARGRSVVPADLGSTGPGAAARLQTPTKIVIPIEVDLFDRFGVPANPDLFEADAQVGQVIYDDGKVFYNGQRLADGASDQLLLHCQELLEADASMLR